MARVRDAWYVAARSAELGPAPIARTILDTPLVLFRDASGAASALLDRCAHRNVPLSQGWCSAGHLVCAYHGWEYQGDGAVTKVPALSGDQGGKARRAPCFPVREQQGLLWVWLSPDSAPSAEPYSLPHLGEAGYDHINYEADMQASLHASLENILDVLRMGIDSTLLGLGKRSIAELSPADLVIPDGFSPAPGLDDGRDRDVGFPAGVHGGRLSGIGCLLMQVRNLDGRGTGHFR